MEYVMVQREGDERLLIIAKDRVEALSGALGEMKILASLSGTSLPIPRWNQRTQKLIVRARVWGE